MKEYEVTEKVRTITTYFYYVNAESKEEALAKEYDCVKNVWEREDVEVLSITAREVDE